MCFFSLKYIRSYPKQLIFPSSLSLSLLCFIYLKNVYFQLNFTMRNASLQDYPLIVFSWCGCALSCGGCRKFGELENKKSIKQIMMGIFKMFSFGESVEREKSEKVFLEDTEKTDQPEKQPEDDHCPICFGDFTIPCRTNCGHWFCGTTFCCYL